MPKVAFRQEVSIPGLLSVARRAFAAIPEHKKRCQIPLVDHLMSARPSTATAISMAHRSMTPTLTWRSTSWNIGQQFPLEENAGLNQRK